jgi:transcriptional regulator
VRGVLARLTRQHEANEPRPWKMSEAPADYLAELLAHIVGIEVRLTRLEGKRKLSQQYSQADREGVMRGLEARGERGLAQAMREVKAEVAKQAPAASAANGRTGP